MAIHLKYGGSSAHRTLACPGWLKKSEGIPSRPAGTAAILGSMHHEVQERCQRDEVAPEQCIGLIYKEPGTDITLEFTEDDLDLAYIMFEATNALLDDLDIDEMLVEPFVELVPGVAGGSIDLLGLSADRKTLLVADYKTGSVKVDVEANPNLSLYTISAAKDPSTSDLLKEVEEVVFAIIQPRVKGVVKTWKTPFSVFKKFSKTFLEAMKSDTLSPGPHCTYCPAEPYCEVKRSQVMGANLLGARFQDELQAAADVVEEVESWVKAIHEELYLQLNRGVPLKGWKIVDKRPTTKWTDEKGAKALLKEKRIAAKDITKPASLMTPIQIGKILKKKGKDIDLSEFIVSESSGTTLAPEDDSRDAVIVSDVQGHLKEMMK